MRQYYQTTNPLQAKIHLCKISIGQARRRRKTNENQNNTSSTQKNIDPKLGTIVSLQTRKQISNIIEAKARRRREKKLGVKST